MDKLWCITFAVLAFFAQRHACEDIVPQIKVVGSQIDYLNSYYSKALVYTINRKNATFNHLNMYWDMKRDLPAGTSVYMKVYVTNSTYQEGTLVLNSVTPVCKESSNRHLLPNVLVVPEASLNTVCLKKGLYVYDKLEQYRFEVLLTDLQEQGSYYRVEYTFGTPIITVGKVTYYNEWGYLNST